MRNPSVTAEAQAPAPFVDSTDPRHEHRTTGAHVSDRSTPSPLHDPARRATRRDERGEGVISVAIAVLIMAFLGVALWKGFQTTLEKTQQNVDQQVTEIGK